MKSSEKHLETLDEIRSLMERSSRFISLSGLSGVSAGVFALLGISMVFIYLGMAPFAAKNYHLSVTENMTKWGLQPLSFFALNAFLVLVFAITSGIFFTTRKAKKKGQKVWDKLTWRLLINLSIPLLAGGIFCLALLKYRMIAMIAPATLVFYGLALVNGSKYTLSDIRYLGIIEVGLGLLAIFNLGYGLEFWALGFGILHIIYGTMMYVKYEQEG